MRMPRRFLPRGMRRRLRTWPGQGALALCLLILMGAAGWWALGNRDTTLVRIQESGVWRVGMDPSFPPFEDIDPETGQAVGFDVELAQAIAARWGVRVEIVGVGFDELLDAVAAHRVDSAISGLPLVPQRTEEVSFSAPYVEAGVVLAVPEGSEIDGPAALAGRRVAVEWGSAGDVEARRVQKELEIDFELVQRESPATALAAAGEGEADAVIIDAVSLALFNQTGPTLTAVGTPLRSDPYVIVVPADTPQLLAEINATLDALAQDGTLAAIAHRWLGPGPAAP